MAAEEVTRETRIITVCMDKVKKGMIVSGVTEVLTIDDSVIEFPQGLVKGVNADFLVGVTKIDSRLVILLDLSEVLSTEEVKKACLGQSQVENAAATFIWVAVVERMF